MEEVREYERTMQDKTNCKVKSSQNAGEAEDSGVTQVMEGRYRCERAG